MATNHHSVKVDLHPMHLQVLANLAILQASEDPSVVPAIAVLQQVDEALRRIGCRQMAFDVTFRTPGARPADSR